MQIVIDGNVVNYQDTKEGDKNILILPGWKRNFEEWQKIINFLSLNFRVISIDFPGFGRSLRPKDNWDIFDYAKFIKKFMEKIQIKNCSIIGHSFGGRIGIILASQDFPIDKLILVDAAGIEKKNLLLKSKIVLAKLLKPIIPKSFIRQFLRGDYAESGEMKEIFKKIVSKDLTSLLPKIKTQTTIIWGEQDKILPLSHAKILHNKIKNSKLRIVWGAAHDPHLEKPDQFMEILEESLAPVIPVQTGIQN